MTRTQKDTQTGGQSQMGSPKTTQVSTFILMSVQTHPGGSQKKAVVAATCGGGNQGTQDHLGEEGLHFTKYNYFICIFIMRLILPKKSAYKKETSQQL